MLFVINPFVTKCYKLSHAIVKDCMCKLHLKSIWFLITFANMMQLIVLSSFEMDDLYSSFCADTLSYIQVITQMTITLQFVWCGHLKVWATKVYQKK
jgi:hypothetical protein